MNIIFDINHPAHVHYFKYVAKILRQNGHSVLFVARNRNPVFELLNYYNENYISRGKGADSFVKKLLYYPYALIKLIIISLKFRPDIYVSFSTPYPHNIAKVFGKFSLAFNDTEHTNKTHKKFTYPFCDAIFTPKCFYEDLGEKHFRFNSFMEMCYLHKNYFKDDNSAYKLLSLKDEQEYTILRFVSWGAHHDVGQSGISLENAKKLIQLVEKRMRVFISSEVSLPYELQKYQILIPPEKMHNILANATLFIGESGTMASECSVLGIPTIYVNSLPLMGYLKEQKDQGLLYHFSNSENVEKKVAELINKPDLKSEWQSRRAQLLKNKIDVTAFMAWLIENYPESIKRYKEDPQIQYKFK